MTLSRYTDRFREEIARALLERPLGAVGGPKAARYEPSVVELAPKADGYPALLAAVLRRFLDEPRTKNTVWPDSWLVRWAAVADSGDLADFVQGLALLGILATVSTPAESSTSALA